MRIRLTLIATACLLPGAALPPEATLQSVYECRHGIDASMALLDGLTAEKTVDLGDANGRNIIRFFRPPAGLTVFGLKPANLAANDTLVGTKRQVVLMSMIPLPYDQVEATVLAANGLKACPDPGGQGNTKACVVYGRYSEPETPGLLLKDFGDAVGIGCGYTRTEG
ncbi:hypothetical protein OF829_12065 [Sphingomonas sp. LB-2]|uniref:hypothetical protein n=1 Tax=Sphingomonas caeni TaxID=2984949 RepID=UPI0022315934|nr:hypothetical protein [Sphingomonas caeni]MCW3847975.1 hypothetical protein [Sphingomonas caeni]